MSDGIFKWRLEIVKFDYIDKTKIVFGVCLDSLYQEQRYQDKFDPYEIHSQKEFFGIDGESDATQEYLSVMFHEAGHLTGHPSRLDRDMDSYHKCKESRAKEELIAEMCSIMVCTELNVIAKAQPNHLKYISSWDRAIKDDSQYLIKCIAQASKAATWILDNKTPKVVVN